MLIKCPECNKEISDKSERCVHCGYPIRNTPYIHEEILGKDYDVSFLLDHSVSQFLQMKQIKEMTGCDLFKAKEVVLKYHPTPKPQAHVPHCPTCNSTNIAPISVASKMADIALFGEFGTKRYRSFQCNNCGYEW